MKRIDEVGKDFDSYVEKWSVEKYQGNKFSTGPKVEHELSFPGDEWGEKKKLIDNYEPIFRKCVGKNPARVLEIGAGAGRLTSVLLENFEDKIEHIHTVDVSETMTNELIKRIGNHPKLTTHVIKDHNLPFEPDSFDLIVSQSCWSHINQYHQYIYLRDLRKVITKGGYLVVLGVFLTGFGVDWTWDNFRRRIYQIDHNMEGINHEFIGGTQLGECLARLAWKTRAFFPNNGFIAQYTHENREIMHGKWSTIPEHYKQIPYFQTPKEYGMNKLRGTIDLVLS
jgi:SAM-dependent methyltransferase